MYDKVLVQLSYEQFRLKTFFESMDGMKGLGMLSIVWFHGPGVSSAFPALGGAGLDLIFTISGFIVTTLLLRDSESVSPESAIRQFWRRRILRIAPLYFAVLAFYVAASWVTRHQSGDAVAFLRNLPYFLTFTMNWLIPMPPTFRVAWALASEVQFYVIWSAVTLWIPKRAFWMLGLLVVLSRGVSPILKANGAQMASTILRSVEISILLGILVAQLLHRPATYGWLNRLLSRPWVPALAFGAVLALLLVQAQSLWWRVGLAVLVGSCAVRERHWMTWLFGHPWIDRIGFVSYGIFLFHPLLYAAAAPIVGRAAARSTAGFVVVIALSWAVAEVSYRYFESRFWRRTAGARVADDSTTPLALRVIAS